MGRGDATRLEEPPANPSQAFRIFSSMETTINPFEDPVVYLGRFGIEAELVAEVESALPAAA